VEGCIDIALRVASFNAFHAFGREDQHLTVHSIGGHYFREWNRILGKQNSYLCSNCSVWSQQTWGWKLTYG